MTIQVKTRAHVTPKAYDIKVKTIGGVAVCHGCLIVKPAPTLLSASPTVKRGVTTKVTVKGTGFVKGLTVALSVPGATVSAPSAVSAKSFKVEVTVPKTTATGAYAVTVTDPDYGSAVRKLIKVTR